ncbi:MAG TPA: SRPBCC domain-containing protein, partial [Candidatus Synoicihabitans sp.]|nr:SRPBCC domain-containing protein [Candidatus Synoicihabitans sp.]
MKPEKLITIAVTHRFSASAERVFDAFLDPRKAAQFMFVTEGGEIVRCDIDPRVGGKFVITDRRQGEDVAHEGEYLEIERPRRLVFTITVKKYSADVGRVEIAIKPLDEGCELTLTQRLSADWIERKSGIEAGWKGILVGLERTLVETGLYVDQSITIRAPAKTIWRVLTDADLSWQWIQTWWPDVRLKSDWQLGSPVQWEMADGVTGAEGEVAESNPPSRLVFTF